MKKLYKISLLLLCLTCLVSVKAFAIDGDGDFPSDVPIDGGLSLLVAAGVGYGMKKIRAGRKK